MWIEKIQIKNFGKFHEKTIEFEPGLNIVYGANESGKTTIHNFLTGMLFGIEKSRGRAGRDDLYGAYEPWNSASFYVGNMIMQIDGKRFFLERNFYHKEKSAKLRNLEDNEELSVEFGDLSMLLGGLTRENYQNTYCIRQAGFLADESLAGALENYMSDVSNSGDGSVRIQAALEDLSKKKKAVEKDYEVVLAGLQFGESILQTADEMKDSLAQLDDTKSPAFLLRNNVNTEENRNLLNEHGYTELILYDNFLQAGMQENGKPYICYGFFRQPVYYSDYISQVVTAHTIMLAAFNFSTIQSGTLQISDVERFMTMADDRKAANELRYVDLNSAFQAVADQNTTQQERQESYEKYEAEQKKRIQELEEKISAIYSCWDEY